MNCFLADKLVGVSTALPSASFFSALTHYSLPMQTHQQRINDDRRRLVTLSTAKNTFQRLLLRSDSTLGSTVNTD